MSNVNSVSLNDIGDRLIITNNYPQTEIYEYNSSFWEKLVQLNIAAIEGIVSATPCFASLNDFGDKMIIINQSYNGFIQYPTVRAYQLPSYPL